MALLGLGRRRAVMRAERERRRRRDPETFRALALACLDAGLGRRAVETLQEGCEAFPDDRDLAALHDEVSWAQLRQQARALQERIDADPRPDDIVALSRLFVQVGDLRRAVDTLGRACRQFPESVAVHLEMARLRLRTWQAEYLAADAAEAIQHLGCVLGLEDHVEALASLARLYLQIGAFQEAVSCYERLAGLNLKHLSDAEREDLDRLAALARDCVPSQAEHDIETLLDAVEAAREPIVNVSAGSDEESRDDGPEAGASPAEVRARVLVEAEQLASEPAVRAVLVQDREARPGRLEFMGLDADEAVASALEDVVASAEQACQRMEIGRLQQEVVCSPTGAVAVLAFDDEAVACAFDADCRPSRVERRLNEYRRSVLRAAGVGAKEGNASGPAPTDPAPTPEHEE